jgi:hypothetical protein
MTKRTAPYNRVYDAQINVRLPQSLKDEFEAAVGKGKMNDALLAYIRRTVGRKAVKVAPHG